MMNTKKFFIIESNLLIKIKKKKSYLIQLEVEN